jgi:hypothetical protein
MTSDGDDGTKSSVAEPPSVLTGSLPAGPTKGSLSGPLNSGTGMLPTQEKT